jgi:Protein of unknown function (DUF2948)
MDSVKFIALDKEDLEVVSAHLQDAEIRVADVHWRPAEKRLVLAVDRFDWPAAIASVPELRRCRAALRFERVLACKCKNVNPAGKDQVLNLLAVEFTESIPPGGVVTLTFSGGATLRLEVECLEAELADLGPIRVANCCPSHLDDVAQA